MKLIKKADVNDNLLRKLSFAEEMDSCAPAQALPDWIDSASALRRTGGQASAPDAARIEKAAYENGFRQGEKAGLEIAEKKVEATMRRYSDAIAEIGRLKPALYAQAERDVVKLALEVAKKIIHREVRVDQEIVQTLIKIALSRVATKSAVTVHLHPADYNFVLEQRRSTVRNGEGDPEIVLVADKSVDRGGCLVETECGDIDARIEEQFREVERAFLGGGE